MTCGIYPCALICFPLYQQRQPAGEFWKNNLTMQNNHAKGFHINNLVDILYFIETDLFYSFFSNKQLLDQAELDIKNSDGGQCKSRIQ